MNKKKIFVIIGCIVLLLSFFGLGLLYRTQKYQDIVTDIKVKDVNLKNVSDGNYEGKFDAILVGAKVRVSVQNHKIVDIKLIEHKNDQGKNAEVIPKKVIEKQSIEIDTISGATNSSKVILKSIENALKKAN